MTSFVPLTTVFPGLVWLMAALALVQGLRRAALWRVGAAAPVAWLDGLAKLPRRYLVDVHHVVARDAYASRMHAVVAGGLIAASILTALAILPPLADFRPYWFLVALAFGVTAVGSLLVGARRYPQKQKRLSAGRFQILPFLLVAYAVGGTITALILALGGGGGLFGSVALALAAAGGLGLAFEVRHGPMRHAAAGALHLVAHPRPGRFEGRPDTALQPLDLDAPRLGSEMPADFTWNRLLSYDACVSCGRCETACPAFAAGQPLNPKKLIQDLVAGLSPAEPAYAGNPYPGGRAAEGARGALARLIGPDARIHPDTLWSCTTCRACVEECPMMIEHVDAVVSLRRHETLERGALPEKAVVPVTELRQSGDPGGRPLASRTDFAAGLDLPRIAERERVDVLLWLGEGAYDLRYGRSLRALVRLLREAQVDFAVLGAEERDTGDLARRLGDEATFQALARENIATLAKYRFKRIVTADPHALHALRNEYPAFGGHYTVTHHTALLLELIRAGKLNPGRLPDLSVTYHDPCYLARYNGETEAPRAVLDAIGVTRREMTRSGRRAMCCGGGGGAPVSDVPGERRIPDIRMAQAAETGAGIVAVACPSCTAMLEGVTDRKAEIRDVAELLLQAVEAGR
ncbi:UNVERIFIED_ORG: Fe-S oxidoreductase [Methylobacterium sp. SuP10 SLI 274]|uniref:(Fe-S)-binding protein n=1 Tax=Methylorubrum extorquens TaxID=408 RepID=UPI0020A1D063|nr:(Fe-S)-binding protein [Methylorubrum extorquens]MDF9863966.1 Fe-S oxidoreductase [Methylorubrum pseudosasae]MDH6637559.1 Fe-S oxidoreductase [Methylobacterium sp. SuP10 SLI 274]MDH6666737.1 Fe-S oxidoreductase [Methylorubrum zatmanii]MCP1558645.1 Fe-S oxidoreductase [Methylorubrum extorquens]MDF9792274.1 Fe-S oxidoreductase [Methylorubrum extorquens]